MADVRLKLAPPWITYINKLQAMFDGDPQIAFNVNWNAPSVTIACNNGLKNAALLLLLPSEKTWGNIKMPIVIDGPVANKIFTSPTELFKTVFDKNPAFADCVSPVEEGYFFVDFCYVIFKNCVVQFFNDNLNDAHGLLSTLYQDIAEEIFADASYNLNSVHYCTDVERGALGKPLGEWP